MNEEYTCKDCYYRRCCEGLPTDKICMEFILKEKKQKIKEYECNFFVNKDNNTPLNFPDCEGNGWYKCKKCSRKKETINE